MFPCKARDVHSGVVVVGGTHDFQVFRETKKLKLHPTQVSYETTASFMLSHQGQGVSEGTVFASQHLGKSCPCGHRTEIWLVKKSDGMSHRRLRACGWRSMEAHSDKDCSLQPTLSRKAVPGLCRQGRGVVPGKNGPCRVLSWSRVGP